MKKNIFKNLFLVILFLVILFFSGKQIGLAEVDFNCGFYGYDGTSINTFSCESGIDITSSYKISKNGITYGITLTDPDDISASKFRIQTSEGLKSFAKTSVCGDNDVWGNEECDPHGQELVKLLSDDGSNGDAFGYAVSMN
ncbi:hypothetical protein K8R66_00465, partial [bacterium]|nr:hypothetical protein [bacterium]